MDVIVYFNTHPNHFLGYEHGHPVRQVFRYEAPEPDEPRVLADEAFRAFNAPRELVSQAYRAITDKYRAAGLRSFSVGDVLQVDGIWLACAAADWVELEQAPQLAPAPDAPVDLLVVTPRGDVWDYSVWPDETGRVTSRDVLVMLYELIRCDTVDVVQLAPDIDMWVDDEGALKADRRVNQLASYIATRFGLPLQLYVGISVFSGGPNDAGDTTSLSGPARERLLGLIAELRTTGWQR